MDKQAQRSAYTQENIGLQEREFWHKLQPEWTRGPYGKWGKSSTKHKYCTIPLTQVLREVILIERMVAARDGGKGGNEGIIS